MFGDSLPPTAYNLGVRTWVPTLELTAYVRARPAPGWLRISMVTRNLLDGQLEEDIEVLGRPATSWSCRPANSRGSRPLRGDRHGSPDGVEDRFPTSRGPAEPGARAVPATARLTARDHA